MAQAQLTDLMCWQNLVTGSILKHAATLKQGKKSSLQSQVSFLYTPLLKDSINMGLSILLPNDMMCFLSWKKILECVQTQSVKVGSQQQEVIVLTEKDVLLPEYLNDKAEVPHSMPEIQDLDGLAAQLCGVDPDAPSPKKQRASPGADKPKRVRKLKKPKTVDPELLRMSDTLVDMLEAAVKEAEIPVME
jgi:hypothetical protein